MPQDQPAVAFLQALAAGILQEEETGNAAARAHDALRAVLAGRKSLVLDVQFTGFTAQGQLVGGVDPRLLRAAGQLIMARVSRVGFTADAREEDLAAFLGLAAKSPAALAGKGIVEALGAAAVRGVYLSTSTGDTYRPAPATPAAAPPPAATETAAEPQPPAQEASPRAPEREDAPPAAAEPTRDVLGFHVEEFSFSDFEILEAFPGAPSPEAAAGDAEGEAAAEDASALRPPPPEGPGAMTGGGSGDLFHFFRAAGPSDDPPPAELKRMLHAAGSVNVFDEVAQSCARVAQRLVEDGAHGPALDLLDALVREAQRPDRTRLFRENAVAALRRVGADGTLHYLVELLRHEGERERVFRIFTFVGGDALVLLEGTLFRAADAPLRRELLRCLLPVEGMGPRLRARAMSDAAPPRVRALLEAAVEVADAETAGRWVADAAAHPDPAVRADAARHAAALGGRASLRLLVELLGHADRTVLRAAVHGLGALGDPAAVTFLARTLGEDDEEVQLAALQALGRIGSGEAVPHLAAVVNRRQLFGAKKLLRVKAAALGALGKIPTPAARDVLATVAAGRDGDLAPEARRILSLQMPS